MVKPQIRGLVSQGTIPVGFGSNTALTPTNTLDNIESIQNGIFNGVVCNIRWIDIEPTEGVFDFSQIDAFLALLASYNVGNPFPLVCRLRLWAGVHAPNFALNGTFAAGSIGGPLSIYTTPVTVHLPLGTLIQVGLYWHPIYLAAYYTMLQALAAAYDSNPLVASVTITSFASQDDEPMNELTDVFSANTLESAGRTDAAMLNAIATLNTNWPFTQTSCEFPITQFKQLDTALLYPLPPQTAEFVCNVTKGSTLLVVSSVTSGSIGIGNTLKGQPIDIGTTITHQNTGSPGGPGRYTINKSTIDIDASNVTILAYNGPFPFAAVNDDPTTLNIMSAYRAALGPLAILSNHALHTPLSTGEMGFYPGFLTNGPPITFQTTLGLYSANGDNLTPSVALGVNTYQADSVELHDLTGTPTADSFTKYPLGVLLGLRGFFYPPFAPYHWHWATTT